MRHTGFLLDIAKIGNLLLLTAILYSCGLVVRPKVAFVVKNESDYNVDISFYGKGVLLRGISLPQGDQFDTTLVEELDSQTLSPFPRETDSIAVVFDSRRVIIQSCNGELLYGLSGRYGHSGRCAFKKDLMVFNGQVENDRFYPKTSNILTFDNSDYERAVEL